MIEDIIKDLQESFDKTLKGLGHELSKLRTGRANINMLEGVRVDYYGQQVPINQVGTMRVADARMITVTPWEKPMLGAIEKAILTSDLNLNPSNDGIMVRVPIPALTGERRQDLIKVARRAGEDHKISLRNARRDANEMIKALQKEGDITEDQMHRALATINQSTDEYTKKIDETLTSKESDIMEV